MSGPMQIVLIVAAIGYLLVRRMTGEPAQARRMLVLPAVLSVIGLNDVSEQVKDPLSLVFLAGTAAVSILLGVLRGASVHISQRHGLAFVRYTGITVLLWVLNIAVKLGANLALHALAPKDAGVAANSLLFTLGLGIVAEGLVILYRALRRNHRVMWTQGRNGAPHQVPSFLDSLRQDLTHHHDEPRGHRHAPEWNTHPEQLRDHRR
ncbi:DUF1453 domain-containing protein [Streptomyces sp. NPDC052109]|uniref:DUF1453 domain-containing protein n=1 Tax=Streptomyces sp. NPDC052109 TaxID=3155527 RepID=UPI00343BF22B